MKADIESNSELKWAKRARAGIAVEDNPFPHPLTNVGGKGGYGGLETGQKCQLKWKSLNSNYTFEKK